MFDQRGSIESLIYVDEDKELSVEIPTLNPFDEHLIHFLEESYRYYEFIAHLM